MKSYTVTLTIQEGQNANQVTLQETSHVGMMAAKEKLALLQKDIERMGYYCSESGRGHVVYRGTTAQTAWVIYRIDIR